MLGDVVFEDTEVLGTIVLEAAQEPTFSAMEAHQMSPAETRGGTWVPSWSFCLRPIHARKRFTS
jgi:hypothetical protein